MFFKKCILATVLVLKNIRHLALLTLLSSPMHLWAQEIDNPLVPLDIPLSVSGTFGEPRSTHFHLGVDIKTQGKEGWEVKSVRPGYVSRIGVSTSGYGKTLYIDHPNKTTTVYAHLKKFAPKVEKLVKTLQYQKESYTLQQFPKKSEITIDQGEVIGYSGNTGSSSGPHLHFEVRATDSQKPLNPLLYGLPVNDRQRPQIQKLILYYPQQNSVLTPSKRLTLQKVNDSTYQTPLIMTSGKIGLGIQMFDRQDLSYNRNGIYQAIMEVNGKKVVDYKFDTLNYSDSDKLFVIVDYPKFKNERYKVVKLFFQNQKPLTFIKSMVNEGMIDIVIGKSYQIKLTLKDFSGNSTHMEMYVEGKKKEIKAKPLDGKLIEPHLEYFSPLDDQEVFIPKNTFFEDAVIEIKKEENTLSIGPNLFPFDNPYEIRFKINKQDSLQLRQTFIAKKTDKKDYYLPTVVKDGFWVSQVADMGDYKLARDSVPPEIKAYNFKPEQWLSKFKFLNIKISDDMSGIKNYRGTINGKWVLFEYEPKRNLLTYDFSDNDFDLAKHELRIEVEDNVGNKSIYETVFFRKYN